MPWLAGTALLHSTLVAQSRGGFMRWTLLLAITTFSLSLVGTFIVRSGVLTSVHAFAVDPERGVFILALLLAATGGALSLYALRSHRIEQGAGFGAVSRDSGLVINNILLVISTATVFLGTFYPLIIDALTGDKITVGPPYFELTFAPLMSLLILFMAVGPLLKWRSDSLSRLGQTLTIMAAIAVAIALATAFIGKTVFGALGVGLAIWLMAGSLVNYAKKLRIGGRQSKPGNFLKRFALLPGAAHGFFLAHIGLAVTTLGIVAMGVWAKEDVDRLKLGERIEIAGYTYTLDAVNDRRGENFTAETATITVTRSERFVTSLKPERRFYPVERDTTTEGAMGVGATRIVYAAMGEGNAEEGWIVRVYYHPLVTFIWFGALMMAIGGFVSLADRRFAFITRPAPPAAAPVPAE
ncbi:MAG: cytochrome c-type biogenesis CcmF C-terminal domain-containing protein, partial [Pseudomonadota bacterium]